MAPGTKTKEAAIQLRRGVTLAERVIRPDGRPVASCVLFCRSYVPFSYVSVDSNYAGATLKIRDGRFELPGCDPGRPPTVFFLDPGEQLGAVAILPVQGDGREPITVSLQPCGTATVRFIGAEGKPIAGFQARPALIVTPGTLDVSDATRYVPFPEFVIVSNLDRMRYSGLRTDALGRCSLPSLIPGARYLLEGREFTVEPGRAADLGDITVRGNAQIK